MSNVQTETNSQLKFMVAAIAIGLSYQIDLRPMGIEYHNNTLEGKLLTVAIFAIIFLYLHSTAVKETYIADND